MELLILKEKDGDRYFSFTTREELHHLARIIVRERYDDGYYEEATNQKVVQCALKDGAVAHLILKDRRNCEYEGFEVIQPQTLQDLIA